MFRCKFLFVLVVLFCNLFSKGCYATWTTDPAQPLPNEEPTSISFGGVFNSCDPTTGVFLATWADVNGLLHPTYSFYNPSLGWGFVNAITFSSLAATSGISVISSCDPSTGVFLATWTEATMNQPAGSVYMLGDWSVLPGSFTGQSAVFQTTNSFYPATGEFLVTWADRITNYPTYSFYTPGSGWGAVSQITMTSTANDVYTTVNTTTNQVLAVWADAVSVQPTYAFYDSGVWGGAFAIPGFPSASGDVLCSCNPVTGQFIAVWVNLGFANFYPYYSIYTPGHGWNIGPAAITNSPVNGNVSVSCDPTTGQFLASWASLDDGSINYSFYTPGTGPDAGWSSPGFITGSTSGNTITTSFNSTSGQFLATWAGFGSGIPDSSPFYSFFTYIPPPAPPNPPPSSPITFTGKVVSNYFLTQIDITHKLVWTPSTDSSIVSYQISRNGVVIAVLPASGPYVYYDHNRSKNKKDLYTIVSINAAGAQSAPLSVIL